MELVVTEKRNNEKNYQICDIPFVFLLQQCFYSNVLFFFVNENNKKQRRLLGTLQWMKVINASTAELVSIHWKSIALHSPQFISPLAPSENEWTTSSLTWRDLSHSVRWGSQCFCNDLTSIDDHIHRLPQHLSGYTSPFTVHNRAILLPMIIPC